MIISLLQCFSLYKLLSVKFTGFCNEIFVKECNIIFDDLYQLAYKQFVEDVFGKRKKFKALFPIMQRNASVSQ